MSYNKNYKYNGYNNVENEIKKQARSFAKKHPVLTIILIVIIIAALIGGYYVYNNRNKKKEVFVPIEGELTFHFLMLGNKYSGDCIYIKAGENDILIDAGSRVNSTSTIKSYVNNYCTDGVLEYVIATHADRDHIACFGNSGGIFDSYKCGTIIDFPLTDKGDNETVKNYISKRDLEVSGDGAVRYSALDCYNNVGNAKRTYQLTESISMEILYNYYYENKSADENNYSVCIMFRHGSRKFLFTGDLEKDGEEKLSQKYSDLGQVELFKAGHHGSYTASNNCLLDIIQPKICVVSCNMGYNEFSAKHDNIFPSQDFINRISYYTDKVYVTTLADTNYTGGKDYTAMNGNVIVISNDVDEEVKVVCSGSNKVLKDTAWFKGERTCPSYWL